MAYSSDLRKIKKESDVTAFGASTKGGQRANRKKTGIRLFHIPSGLVVKSIEERSQQQNLAKALERLKLKLEKFNKPRKTRIKTKPGRAAILRRLESKRRRSAGKKLRQKPEADF